MKNKFEFVRNTCIYFNYTIITAFTVFGLLYYFEIYKPDILFNIIHNTTYIQFNDTIAYHPMMRQLYVVKKLSKLPVVLKYDSSCWGKHYYFDSLLPSDSSKVSYEPYFNLHLDLFKAGATYYINGLHLKPINRGCGFIIHDHIQLDGIYVPKSDT